MSKCNVTAEKFRNDGNVHFRNGELMEALISYNKSVCYAESSESLCLAYANRSAVYLQSNLFKKCLKNIELAKVHGYRDGKLQEREEKCRRIMEEYQTEASIDFFKLSYKPNDKIPFIVNCLELREDEKFGRFIVTNMNLSPGDVIAIEEPFYKFIDKEVTYSRCKNCLKSNDLNLSPCATCVSCKMNFSFIFSIFNLATFVLPAMYCSSKCKLDHEQLIHHVECNKKPLPPVLVVCTKMLLTAVSIAGGLNELRGLLKGCKRQTVFEYDLSNPDDRDYDKNLLIVVNSMAMSESSKIVMSEKMKSTFNYAPFASLWETDDERNFLIECFHNQLRIHNTNQLEMGEHTIEWSNDEPYWYVKTIGSGLCPFASLFNHSCDANIKRTCVGNKIAFIVARPIAAGDQLFLSYGYSSYRMPREERQNLLKRFSFTCDCEACVKNFPLVAQLKRHDEKFVEPKFKTLKVKEAVDQFKKNCEYIKSHIEDHPSYETTMLSIHNDHLLHQIAKEPIVRFS